MIIVVAGESHAVLSVKMLTSAHLDCIYKYLAYKDYN